jgi:uncharacterized protein (TIGR00661 family)
MARILYGVMGNTNGHIMRTRAITVRLPEHEFRFVGGGRVLDLREEGHEVLEVPVLRSIYREGRLSIPATLGQTLACEFQIPTVFARLQRMVESWKPDMLIADREFYLPIFARWQGLPCLSIDHSHVMRSGHYSIPPHLRNIWRLTLLNDFCLFNFTRHNLVTSFFEPATKTNPLDEIFPPILRPEVYTVHPTDLGHIFVYLTTPAFDGLLHDLQQQPRPVIIYGRSTTEHRQGQLLFKPHHLQTVLEDLASSTYAVTNGGHNLLSEALYFGKPVFCIPIAQQVEQYLNAWHVRALGYGDFRETVSFPSHQRMAFESKLDHFRLCIQAGFRDGTTAFIQRLREIITESVR